MKKVDRLDALPETKVARNSWNAMTRGLADGDRLKMVRVQLAIMAEVTPQQRLKQLYAVMANDVADLIRLRDDGQEVK